MDWITTLCNKCLKPGLDITSLYKTTMTQAYTRMCENLSSLASPELKTLEWDIPYPDRIINLEIKWEENKQYLISRLRKRVDQALIPISTILKFPALSSYHIFRKLLYCLYYFALYKYKWWIYTNWKVLL